MKDLYEEFGELYDEHCSSLGCISSGVVLMRDYSVQPPRFQVERIELDWETGDHIWENDWYEGQDCDYIASFTDNEIAHILKLFVEIRRIMENKK